MLDKSSVNIDINYYSNLMSMVIVIIIILIMSISVGNLSAVYNSFSLNCIVHSCMFFFKTSPCHNSAQVDIHTLLGGVSQFLDHQKPIQFFLEFEQRETKTKQVKSYRSEVGHQKCKVKSFERRGNAPGELEIWESRN